MPSKSKAQQSLFGMALAIRRGEMDKSKASDKVLDIVNSDMTDQEIEDFASTKRKSLPDHLKESLLDDEDVLINRDNIKIEIENFLKENYIIYKYKIIQKSNKYIVNSSRSVEVKNKNLTSLTNGLFEWGEVSDFYCYSCKSLKSLEGAPKEVNGYFNCSYCNSLKTLEGAPQKVGGYFKCTNCDSLTSLEGAPQKVGGDFSCFQCPSLKSLEGAPKEVGMGFDCSQCDSLTSLEGAPKEVGGSFICSYCSSLKSLEGAPKEVRGNFHCYSCTSLKTLEGVPQKVGGKIRMM